MSESLTSPAIWQPCFKCHRVPAEHSGFFQLLQSGWDKYKVELYKLEGFTDDQSQGSKEILRPLDSVKGAHNAVIKLPYSLHWYWGHNKCLPMYDFVYYIQASRINTLEKALRWTEQLRTDTPWLEYSDWEDVMCMVFPDYPRSNTTQQANVCKAIDI